MREKTRKKQWHTVGGLRVWCTLVTGDWQTKLAMHDLRVFFFISLEEFWENTFTCTSQIAIHFTTSKENQ